MKKFNQVEHYRERIADRLLLVGSIVSIPSAIFSGYRIILMGFKPLFIADILISILLILTFLIRRRIAFNIRMLSLIFYVFFLGTLSTYTWGLYGFGFFILFFSCIIMTVLFGLRSGIILLIASIIVLLLFTLFVNLNLISWKEDFNSLSHNPYQWISRLVFYISFSSIAIITIGTMYRNLEKVTKAISESEDRYRTLFENANDAILIFKNDQIIDCNSKAIELFKCTKYQLVGLKPSELSPKNQIDGQNSEEKSQELIALALESKPQRFEWRHKKFDGVLFDAEVTLNRLKLNNGIFIQAILRDITDRKHLEQKLLWVKIESEEKERMKLAGDLHDEVGPLLSSLNMYLSLFDREETENKKDIIQTMTGILKDTIISVREISNNISPHVLNNYGLITALKAFVDSKEKLLNITLDQNINDKRLSNNIEVICYRILKELLNNTLKYAEATEVFIGVYRDNDILNVVYNDNGKGFDVDKVFSQEHTGIGLLNIISRLSTIKANYHIQSKPGSGFHFDMKLSLDTL